MMMIIILTFATVLTMSTSMPTVIGIGGSSFLPLDAAAQSFPPPTPNGPSTGSSITPTPNGPVQATPRHGPLPHIPIQTVTIPQVKIISASDGYGHEVHKGQTAVLDRIVLEYTTSGFTVKNGTTCPGFNSTCIRCSLDGSTPRFCDEYGSDFVTFFIPSSSVSTSHTVSIVEYGWDGERASASFSWKSAIIP